MKNIYIVVTQTGTILSRLLKFIKKREYNHVSIGLDRQLKQMYSFGRINPYIAFLGGFVRESPYHGTFKRFPQTKAIVYEMAVPDSEYRKIKRYLRYMYKHRRHFQYNYLGLFLASVDICYQPERHFYCSEFVRDVLVKFHIFKKDQFLSITEPAYFIHIMKNYKCIYKGLLSEYAESISK